MTSSELLREIRIICEQEAFRRGLLDFLWRICEVDTSPAQELARLREGEQRVFQLLGAELAELGMPGGSVVQREISPAIADHPAYSRPYYASGPSAEAYRGRGNLLYLLDREPAAGGQGIALNAHIDTVAPYFPPSRSGGVIRGRGTADDKGNVAVILGTLQVLAELERRGLVAPRNKITAMFVIDEETGGNGSLDLAVDRRLKERYNSVVVMECTGNRLHPANRGAVFIRCACRPWADLPPESRARGKPPVQSSGIGGTPRTEALPSVAEATAFAILELLDEGEEIRRESDHPLFPHRPVQTCTGILGPFGVHPSAICAGVAFEVCGLDRVGREAVREWLERGVRRYVSRYGDKTLVVDPSTGTRKVERHYDLDWKGDGSCTVRVYGASGHMGSLPENDAAITKWAYMVRELVEQRRATGLAFSVYLPSSDPQPELVFEGAQGFLPTHPMEEVKTRARAAFLRGLERYLRDECLPPDSIACDVTFDKLHNEAYACDPGSPTMRTAMETAVEVGLMRADELMRGWEVSCDARLFAREYPGMPVISFGAGWLEHAHSDRERIEASELFRSVLFLALFVLRQTSSIV
jgi:acetylornithine deacetylase/succinyl-diaminopimelate desuccinylase-like protein